MAVIECRDQTDLVREQHSVAEHVAGHVTDARDGERIGVDVEVTLGEVASYRYPGAASGDAHRLVVVAGRTAGSKSVAEPETTLDGDAVRDVREPCGPLVCCHDEIGVFTVVLDYFCRVYRSAVDDVVHHVQQAANEGAVRLLHLRRSR